jgi:dTDP-4-amino-4,6-dideoxygalactose transaminase
LSNWRIPLSDLDYGEAERSAALRILGSKWLSMGPEVEAFESDFAAYVGVRHAIAVANGTAALHLAYLALGLGGGDEIVQPAINFVAAANMSLAVGATPVFADVVALTEPTLDPRSVEELLTERTRAVIVMHYGGYFCRMADLQDLCRRRGLALIEDACHAVGGRYIDEHGRIPNGKRAGAISDVATFSFFSNKNLAVGEGGMVTTDRDDVAAKLRRLRSHGMTTLTWDRHRGHANSYDVSEPGFNYRIDELRAALGRCQLAKLDANNARRREFVDAYRRRLTDLPGWVIPFERHASESAAHLMVAVAPDPDTRDLTRKLLRDAGIQTSLHYPCVPDFGAFARRAAGPVEQSRSFARRAITLPLYPTMTISQVEAVCSVIQSTCAVAAG